MSWLFSAWLSVLLTKHCYWKNNSLFICPLEVITLCLTKEERDEVTFLTYCRHFLHRDVWAGTGQVLRKSRTSVGLSQKGTRLRKRSRLKLSKDCPRQSNKNTGKHISKICSLVPPSCGRNSNGGRDCFSADRSSKVTSRQTEETLSTDSTMGPQIMSAASLYAIWKRVPKMAFIKAIPAFKAKQGTSPQLKENTYRNPQ